MKKIYILIIVTSCFFISCNNVNKINSPLAIVIKFQAAETLIDFEQAKKYIDLNKAYSNHPKSLNPELAWKQSVGFLYNLGKDKKFTNIFKYYEYDIRETITKDNATISFKALSSDARIKEIQYVLEIQNNDWKITGINYFK